jgi:tetratricopeptide (TPR) repeat protein
MPESIDDLYARWQKNPDVSQTVALCDALRGTKRVDLVEIVGRHASRQLDVLALTAAARMYTDMGRLDDAHQVLIAAGRLAPRDGDVYGLLGEVLLRRGDAERAEKVLERALQFGAKYAAQAWLDRARALRATQQSSGMMAVAEEMWRATNAAKRPARQRADSGSDALETQVRKNEDVQAVLAARAGAPMPAAGRPALPAGASAGPVTPVSSALKPAPPSPPLPPPEPFLVHAKAPRPAGPNSQPMPGARDVLEALQIAGVFEPDGSVRPQVFNWDKPERGKRRIGSFASLIALALLIVGGASGAYYYVNDKRAKAHVESENLLTQIDQNLRASDTKLLEPSEQGIARAFDLESRSPHAALTWLHERAMVGLLKGGDNVAFEDATVRAKEVLVEDKRLAFTYVASFLFQGDTAGAASAIAKWDGKADDDPWYQLASGATFERAGDTRALERYAAAVKLDPNLIAAQILLARATAVDGDPHRAAELAKEFRAKYPDRIEGAALVALAWARDPMRGEPPPEAKEIADKAEAVPMPLRAVAPAVRALMAIDQHKNDEAKVALTKGLTVADTPGVAAWLGGIALATGDEALARKGALTAVSYSAVYPPARVLAARVALLGARLDEALKASEELPPTSPDVVIVTAAVAYEKLDGERMRSALDGLPDDAKKLPLLVPLVRGQALLAGNGQALGGNKALDMADDETPWADLVAMDSALDTGDIDLAHQIALKWKTTEPKAMRAVRLARLARWDGKNDDAERLSRLALEGHSMTVRALAERVFVLVAMNKAPNALAVFKAFPNVGGPLAKWLRAYAVASNGKLEEARAILSQEDPPPALAPLPSRLIAAAAYGAVKDTRKGGDYVKALVQAGFPNPDVIVAAQKVGAGKIVRRR